MIIDQNIFQQWIQFLRNRNYSENTIDNYKSDFKLFLNYIRLQKSDYIIMENDITMEIIEKWRTYLSELKTPKTSIYYKVKTTISPSTIQSKLTALKSFLKFLNLIYSCWLDYKKIETKRIKSDYIEVISENEYKTLFDYIWNVEKYRINSLRFQLLINIGYTSWLRLSEMLGLTVSQIKKKETKITGKGNKPRRVFFTHSTQCLLEDYLEERNKPIPRTWKTESNSDYTFISHNSWYDYGLPIKKNTACEIMKRYSDGLDIGKRITIHTLRHSYATRLLESWLNLREIQELLGHSDIKTTEGYCHVLKSNLSDKVNQIFH